MNKINKMSSNLSTPSSRGKKDRPLLKIPGSNDEIRESIISTFSPSLESHRISRFREKKNEEELNIFKDENEEEKEKNKQKHIILNKIMENNWFNLLINFAIIYSLISDDVRILSFSKSSDNIFDSFTILAICLFTFEIVISIFVNHSYFNSFFFWLDTISTITLILDLSWITQYYSDNNG